MCIRTIRKTPLAIIFVGGFLLLLDQFLKYRFSETVSAYCNPAGPWGIPVDNGVFVVVMILALAGVGYLFRKSHGVPFGITFTFLFVGGVSNFLDRIFFGCVRDFSLVSWFPAFNLADALLTIGVAVFLFASFPQRKNPLA